MTQDLSFLVEALHVGQLSSKEKYIGIPEVIKGMPLFLWNDRYGFVIMVLLF